MITDEKLNNRKNYYFQFISNSYASKHNDNKNHILKNTLGRPPNNFINSNKNDFSANYANKHSHQKMKNNTSLFNKKQINEDGQSPKSSLNASEKTKRLIKDHEKPKDARKPVFWQTFILGIFGFFAVVPIYLTGLHKTLNEQKNTEYIDFDYLRNLLNIIIQKFAGFSFIFLLISVSIITCFTMILKGLRFLKFQ